MKEECIRAADFLAISVTFDSYTFVEETDNSRPGGCYFVYAYSPVEVHFNHANPGKAKSYRKPICYQGKNLICHCIQELICIILNLSIFINYRYFYLYRERI